MATTSISGWITSCSWSGNTALIPNASPAARADSGLRALSALISYIGSARSAGMWAVTAQPQAGLTPMIPTPRVDSGITGADVVSRVSVRAILKTEHLVDQHHRDPPRGDLPIDDDHLVHRAVYAICSLGAGVFEPPRIFIDAEQTLLEVGHNLLRADDENDSSGAADIRSQLAAAHGSREQRPGLGDRVDAPEHDIRRRAQAADLVGLGLAIHAPDPRAECTVATGLFDLVSDAQHVERLRGALVYGGGVGDEGQDNPLCRGGVRRPEDRESVRLEGGHGSFHSAVIRPGAPPPGQRSIRVEFNFFDHPQSPSVDDILATASILIPGDCICKYFRNRTPPLISIGSWRKRCQGDAGCGRGTPCSGPTPRFCASSRPIWKARPVWLWPTSTCWLSWPSLEVRCG